MKPFKSVTAGVLLLCVIICLCALLVVNTRAEDQKADDDAVPVAGWQHMAIPHVLDKGYGDLGHQINKAGREGWELVSVANISNEGTTTETVFYFKRPL